VTRRDPTEDLIWGLHSVEEALAGAGRVREVLLDGGSGPGARVLADRAKAAGLPVRLLPPQAFRDLSRGRPFQGIAARVAAYLYADDDATIEAAAAHGDGVLLALDQVQDPQNLGSILRSAAFFGVRGVLLPQDRSAPVSPAAVRASAGAAGRVPVARVVNLARTVRACKDAGFFAVAAVADGGVPPGAMPLPRGPVLLVVGSESEGVRRLVRESCDALVTVPSPGGFESLNVGVAAGVLLHALTVAMAARGGAR